MSKIAIISDVHANKEALKLVLKDIENKNVDDIICLGDLVTKYFYPDVVVDAIKANCSIVIKGNCDELVATDERYSFARSKLGLSRITYLDELPLSRQIKINNIIINLYHSCPHSIDKIFNPLFSGNRFTGYRDKIIYDYNEIFPDDLNQVSIVAHTHQSYIGIIKYNKLKIVKNNLLITQNDRVIVNVGSAGEHSHMVLDHYKPSTIIDPYLTYALLDSTDGKLKVEIVKVKYREMLKEVYVDMLQRQGEGSIPYSPNDTLKIEKSLRLMHKK